MTEAPLKAHASRPWLPDVGDHHRHSKVGDRLSREALEQLGKRTAAIQDEILHGSGTGKEGRDVFDELGLDTDGPAKK